MPDSDSPRGDTIDTGSIDTGGGAHVSGSVNTGGGAFVGHDQTG